MTDQRNPGRPEIGGVVNVRLGDLLDPIDAYAAEHNISRAEAVRVAVRALVGTST